MQKMRAEASRKISEIAASIARSASFRVVGEDSCREDERKVASFIRGLAEEAMWRVARDGAAALDLLLDSTPYDWSCWTSCCPKRDGLDVLKTLRAAE